MNTIKLDYSDVKFADNGKLKLLIIVGTRPEIIRLAAVIMKCRRYFNTVLAHTGQNYDYNLNGIFFKDEAGRPGGVYECRRRRSGCNGWQYHQLFLQADGHN